MTRVDLTVQQCRALGEYLRNRVDRGMGFGYDEIELLVLSCRALLAVSDVPVVCERPTSPPLSLQNSPRRPLLRGAVRRKRRSSSGRR